MAGLTDCQCSETLLQEVQPTLQDIVQRKLRASLNPTDGQPRNQDALQLVNDINVKLLEQLQHMRAGNTSHGIADFRQYASVVSYHVCDDYYRNKYPRWTRLKNSLQYYLRHAPEYAVWEADNGEVVGGLAHWHDERRRPLGQAQVTQLRAAPQSLQGGALPTRAIEHFHRADWLLLLTAIFGAVNAPLALDNLVALITALLGILDEAPSPPLPRSDAGPGRRTEMRQTLQHVWQAIGRLRSPQRMAFLLNPPERGELAIFPYHGVASIRDIGRALALTAAQYEQLWAALPLEALWQHQAHRLQNADEKFAMLWHFLPLEDVLIAQLLGTQRQQVINLRRIARDNIRQQLQTIS